MPLTRNRTDAGTTVQPTSWRQRMRRALSPRPTQASSLTISAPSNLQLSPSFPRVEYHRGPSPLHSRSQTPNPFAQDAQQFDSGQPQDGDFVRVIRLANGTRIIIPADDEDHVFDGPFSSNSADSLTSDHDNWGSYRYSPSPPRSNAALYYRQSTELVEDDQGGHAQPPVTYGRRFSDDGIHSQVLEDSNSLLNVDLNERFRYVAEEDRPIWYRKEDGCPHMHGPGHPSYLCATCRRIDFVAILNQGETETIPPLIDFIVLGPLSTIIQKHQCGFCKLVVQIWTVPFLRQAPYDISFDDKRDLISSKLVEHGQDMYYLFPVRFKSEYGVPALHLGKNIWNQGRNSLVIGSSNTFLPSRDLAIRPMSVSRPDSDTPPIPRFGRFIQSEQIDLDWIKQRISLCDERSVRGIMRYRGILRAIDVQQLCVVDLEDDQRYVTLSYVWGGITQLRLLSENIHALRTPGGIAQRIAEVPRTVRDAIKLTRLIGERFLWVDALCIIQNDDADRNQQIMKMGDVYQQSTLTIIACCGNDASYGLPGLEPGTRKVHQVAAVVGHQAMSNMLPWDDIMLASRWSTRAWTMQEKMLSRRKLIITDAVVMWWCWHSSNPEDEHCRHHYWPPGERDKDMIYFNTENDRVVSKRGTLSAYDMYIWLLWDYTKRNISNQRDAANAFQGAFNALAARLNCEFIHGLPDTELEDALLWCPIGSSTRRVDEKTGESLFPSWSWLGWSGKAAYPGHSERDFPASSVNSPLQWYSATSAEIFTGEEYRAWNASEGALDYTSLRQHWKRHTQDNWCWVKEVNGQVESHMPLHHPVNSAGFWRPFRFLPEDSDEDDELCRQLEFKTLSARFMLGDTKFQRKENFDYEHKMYQQCVFDASGYSAGYIYTPDPDTMEAAQRGHFRGIQEFIVISRASMNSNPLVGTAFLERDIFQSSLSLTLPATARAGFAGTNRPALDNASLDEKAYFDNRIYYKTNQNPWCLFNVLMIRRDSNNIAHRVAVGRIHVGAFVTQNPTWEEIKMR